MPLLEAIQVGDLTCVRRMIAAGTDLSATDENEDFTALGHAAFLGGIEIVRALLDAGAPADDESATACALAAAALGGQVEAARILVEAGATLDLADETGMTPLIQAALVGQLAVVRYLIETGADLHHRDLPDHVHAKSALDYAVDEGFPEVATYLLERGARFEPEVYLEESGATPKNASDLIELAHRNWAAKRLQDG